MNAQVHACWPIRVYIILSHITILDLLDTARTGNDNDQLGEDAEPDLEDVAK